MATYGSIWGANLHLDAIFENNGPFEVTEVPDGFIVSDTKADRVHFLNNTAAIIYEMCDGNYTFREIVEFIDQTYSLETTSSAEVASCIRLLEAENLIQKCSRD